MVRMITPGFAGALAAAAKDSPTVTATPVATPAWMSARRERLKPEWSVIVLSPADGHANARLLIQTILIQPGSRQFARGTTGSGSGWSAGHSSHRDPCARMRPAASAAGSAQ